jgi:hypothetical protein
MKLNTRHRQRGVTLIIGLVMLLLVAIMVTSAYTLSSTNLKSVGNMQFRNESVAAANKAIEQVVGINFAPGFLTLPPVQTIAYDMNNDGVTDYTVTVAVPTCIQATQTAGVPTSGLGSSIDLIGFESTSSFNTLWDITATVTDAVSGTAVTVSQGVRTEITVAQRNSLCPG